MRLLAKLDEFVLRVERGSVGILRVDHNSHATHQTGRFENPANSIKQQKLT